MGTVMVFKLISGEEILANLVDTSDNYITLSKPRVLQIMQGRDGPSAAIVPWVITMPDAVITVYKNCIAAQCTASSDVERSYLSQTSGIDLSSAPVSKIVM